MNIIDFLCLFQFKRFCILSPQGRALPNTPRLTSLPQRRPTKSARSMHWVGRRASTLWSWEERGRRIDFFTSELLISAGCFCQAPNLLHPNVKFARNAALKGFIQSRLFMKYPHRFIVGFHFLNTDYFWNSFGQIYCTHSNLRKWHPPEWAFSLIRTCFCNDKAT